LFPRSRATTRKQQITKAQVAEDPEQTREPAREGPVLLRRLVLALATTLIVARPLVVGEDPGLTANLADPWGLMLTLCWLLAAVGWAAWRYWLRPDSAASGLARQDAKPQAADWYGGLVQVGLLAMVALVFVSAEAAADYKFPARLIAWEWFGLLVSFFLMRQLAVTPSEQHGLFAVVLAGAAALAAQGIYQEIVEMPSNRRLAQDRQQFRKIWIEENPGQQPIEGLLEQLRRRALQSNIYGPYAHPNSYAGFLVLLLPGLIGAVVVCRRMRAQHWQTILTGCFAVLGLAALWLTHSRGAILGLAAAGFGVVVIVYRHHLRAHALAALIGSILLIGLCYGVLRSGLLTTGMGKTGNTIALRLEYWQTTLRMIHQRPWLGVGPGNFGENYPRLMPESAEEKIKDPHNFALEIWATCGIFALLALLVALAGFFQQVITGLRRMNGAGEGGCVSAPREALGALTQPCSPEEAAPDSASAPVRWEYYVGGMFGLLVGFVLRINTATDNGIMTETYSAAVRSVVWFGAFGLFERIFWTDRGRALALTTGIVALLLNLCVSGGIGFPSVAGPLCIALALALNAVSLRPVAWLSRAGVAMILPLPLFLGLFLAFGVYVLYPVLAGDGLVREAVKAADYFNAEREKPLPQQNSVIRDNPAGFLQKTVVGRLEQAKQLTPDDARIYVQLAWWNHAVWDLTPSKSTQQLSRAENALRFGGMAVRLDPRGAPGYLVQYRIRMRYAELNRVSARKLREAHGDPLVISDRESTARRQCKLAADTLEQFLPNDPHDTNLHYALAEALYMAGDTNGGRQYAEEAVRLDKALTFPSRKLTDPQRKQLDEWIQKPPAS